MLSRPIHLFKGTTLQPSPAPPCHRGQHEPLAEYIRSVATKPSHLSCHRLVLQRRCQCESPCLAASSPCVACAGPLTLAPLAPAIGNLILTSSLPPGSLPGCPRLSWPTCSHHNSQHFPPLLKSQQQESQHLSGSLEYGSLGNSKAKQISELQTQVTSDRCHSTDIK